MLSITQFYQGISYALNGFKLINQPYSRQFVIIPLLINILVFTLLFLLSKHWWGELTHWIENFLPSWLQWLGNLLWVFFLIGFILIMLFTFTLIGNLVSAPFNSILAEKIEIALTKIQPKKSTQSILLDIPRAISRQIKMIGYYLPRALILLIVFFIPFIQLIAVPLWLLFNAWYMALQYLDYPSDNHKIPLATVLQAMKQHHSCVLGFGSAILLLSMVPIVNFFVIPAATAGATLLWIKELAEQHE